MEGIGNSAWNKEALFKVSVIIWIRRTSVALWSINSELNNVSPLSIEMKTFSLILPILPQPQLFVLIYSVGQEALLLPVSYLSTEMAKQSTNISSNKEVTYY